MEKTNCSICSFFCFAAEILPMLKILCSFYLISEICFVASKCARSIEKTRKEKFFRETDSWKKIASSCFLSCACFECDSSVFPRKPLLGFCFCVPAFSFFCDCTFSRLPSPTGFLSCACFECDSSVFPRKPLLGFCFCVPAFSFFCDCTSPMQVWLWQW